MKERLDKEIALIRQSFPDAEYREDTGWVRLPKYSLPKGIWQSDIIEISFQIPKGYPGQAPYAFYVKPLLRLKSNNQKPQSYEDNAQTPFGNDWGKVSWQHVNWKPSNDVKSGSNLNNFVSTFIERFKEAS